jgi:hypothetical protein
MRFLPRFVGGETSYYKLLLLAVAVGLTGYY